MSRRWTLGELRMLHACARIGADLARAAQKTNHSAQECDVELWRRIGRWPSSATAPVQSKCIAHDPKRQSFGREPVCAPPNHGKHLQALGQRFPAYAEKGR